MNLFVTGGSGFIGGHVIEHLVRAGHAVTALSRSARADDVLRGFGATPVRGDLDTLSATALGGVDVFLHAAAWAKSWGRREDFVRANVEGTRRALAAAKAAGVPRFVHVGTEAAFFTGAPLLDLDETAGYPAAPRYLYSETKAEAERLVLAANEARFTTLSLRPRLVWGPRDASVLPEVLEAVQRGAFSWIDHGAQQTSTTYVGNFCVAVEAALTRGRGGEAYFIADDGTRTMRDFLTALAGTRAVTLPARSLPGWVARPAARLTEAAFRLFAPSRKPPLVRFAVDFLSRSVTVKTDKARVELGYRPRFTVEEGLRLTQQG